MPQATSGNPYRRGNTADALKAAAIAATEERKENRIMMGRLVADAQKPPARFQQAAANVLGTSNYNKPAEERRNTVAAYGMLPPSGYRGQSLQNNQYNRGGGTAGNTPAAIADAFGGGYK